jgi:hypothetical protein
VASTGPGDDEPADRRRMPGAYLKPPARIRQQAAVRATAPGEVAAGERRPRAFRLLAVGAVAVTAVAGGLGDLAEVTIEVGARDRPLAELANAGCVEHLAATRQLDQRNGAHRVPSLPSRSRTAAVGRSRPLTMALSSEVLPAPLWPTRTARPAAGGGEIADSLTGERRAGDGVGFEPANCSR